MQFARTLEKRQAILDESFELIECWEHDFKRRQLYPKKKTETFPHIIVFDFESVLDTSKRKQATKCRCPFCRQTLWIERQSTPVAKIPKSGAGDSRRRLSVWTRLSEKAFGDTFLAPDSDVKVANKQNKAMYLSTPSFKFLDIINFISYRTSYDERVKMYGAKLSKSWFPYKWFDTAE
ncbi:unnamed protein product, partial [Porites evermanni]